MQKVIGFEKNCLTQPLNGRIVMDYLLTVYGKLYFLAFWFLPMSRVDKLCRGQYL